MKERTSKIAICFLAAAALAGTAYLFFNTGEHPHEDDEDHEHEMFVALNQQQIEDAGITLRAAGPGQLQQIINSPGKIVLNSKKLVHVVPSVAGTVKETTKNVGDSVNMGELLAVLESHELAEAKSAFLDSVKKEQQASNNLEREKNLFEKRISSEIDYQTAFTDSEKARIELDLAKQKLLSKGLTHAEIQQLKDDPNPKLGNYHIRSGMQGVVIYKNITKGEMVDPSREVYVIADLNTVVAELKVFPKDLPYIAEGYEIDIHSPEGKKSQAIIASVSPIIDEDTYSVSVTALLNNIRRDWKPGMYINADIKGMPEQVSLLVPKAAIQKIDNKDSIFIANQDNFEIRPIKIGRSDDISVEITSGLSPGELYASSNTFLLKAEHGKHEAQHMD